MKTKPLSRNLSQTERAALGIRDLVLSGTYKPDERITELSLVDKLAISRTPIRAALQQLCEEGLLAPAKSSGYCVRRISQHDIYDAIEARGAIEGLAARMAAERGVAPKLLERMRSCLHQIDSVLANAEPGDERLTGYASLNKQFHEMLVEASGSNSIALALDRVASLPFASANAFAGVHSKIPEEVENLKDAQKQHYEILNAIKNRSSARAEPLAREHALMARKNLELIFGYEEVLTQLVGAPLLQQSLLHTED